jgi:hypothetical protein
MGGWCTGGREQTGASDGGDGGEEYAGGEAMALALAKYQWRVVLVFVKGGGSDYALVLGKGPGKKLRVVWFLTREQALDHARCPKTSEASRRELAGAGLGPRELLFTDWEDSVRIDALDPSSPVPVQLFGDPAGAGLFCRYACEYKKHSGVEFIRDWTLREVAQQPSYRTSGHLREWMDVQAAEPCLLLAPRPVRPLPLARTVCVPASMPGRIRANHRRTARPASRCGPAARISCPQKASGRARSKRPLRCGPVLLLSEEDAPARIRAERPSPCPAGRAPKRRTVTGPPGSVGRVRTSPPGLPGSFRAEIAGAPKRRFGTGPLHVRPAASRLRSPAGPAAHPAPLTPRPSRAGGREPPRSRLRGRLAGCDSAGSRGARRRPGGGTYRAVQVDRGPDPGRQRSRGRMRC